MFPTLPLAWTSTLHPEPVTNVVESVTGVTIVAPPSVMNVICVNVPQLSQKDLVERRVRVCR